ncbi:hypothetical protein ACOSP7_032953 [Xanthoceras sorbifolium]
MQPRREIPRELPKLSKTCTNVLPHRNRNPIALKKMLKRFEATTAPRTRGIIGQTPKQSMLICKDLPMYQSPQEGQNFWRKFQFPNKALLPRRRVTRYPNIICSFHQKK